MLMRFALAVSMCALAFPATAKSKEEVCALQAEVVSAIQQARLDRVRQDEVVPTLMAANPEWPEAMSDAMPQTVEWVYGIRRRDLRKVELGPVSEAQCLENWEKLQALTNN